MKDRWPWLLLLIVPMVLFPGAIPGPEVVSADDHLSVHHAFQSEAGGSVRHPHLSDPALQFKSLRKAVIESFKQGEVPLWNPTIWTGAPLLGDAQSMVGSPVTWIHLVLPSRVAADASVVWLLIWVGLGCGLLARQLGANTWGSVVSATAGMTSPYISVWLLHPHSATAVWIPWVLWAMEKRTPVLIGICTAGLLAGGHPETAVHGGMFAAAWWLFRSRSLTIPLGVTLGVLLSAPITMPFVEEALRSATLSAHGGNTLAPKQLLDLVWPNWHGHPATETWTSSGVSWANGRIHPGIGALALGCFAVFQRRKPALFLVALFVVSVLISVLGIPGPLNHARLASIGALLIAVSAGLSVRASRGPLAFLFVLGTGAWAGWHDQGSVRPEIHDPTPAPWTKTLKTVVEERRVIGLSWALQPNTGALVGLDDLRGYDLPVSVDTERLQMALNPRPIRPWFQLNKAPPANILRWAGVRAILSPTPLENPVNIGDAPLYATMVNEVFPLAWKATAPVRVPTPAASIQALKSAKPEAPPVEELNGIWPTSGHVQPATRFQRTTRTVAFHVRGPDAGIAVLPDAWHPGWTVEVNGVPAQPLRVGGVFRGVKVGPGEHMVKWRFEPWGWHLGCILFGFGLVLSSILTWRFRRKRRKEIAPIVSNDRT